MGTCPNLSCGSARRQPWARCAGSRAGATVRGLTGRVVGDLERGGLRRPFPSGWNLTRTLQVPPGCDRLPRSSGRARSGSSSGWHRPSATPLTWRSTTPRFRYVTASHSLQVLSGRELNSMEGRGVTVACEKPGGPSRIQRLRAVQGVVGELERGRVQAEPQRMEGRSHRAGAARERGWCRCRCRFAVAKLSAHRRRPASPELIERSPIPRVGGSRRPGLLVAVSSSSPGRASCLLNETGESPVPESATEGAGCRARRWRTRGSRPGRPTRCGAEQHVDGALRHRESGWRRCRCQRRSRSSSASRPASETPVTETLVSAVWLLRDARSARLLSAPGDRLVGTGRRAAPGRSAVLRKTSHRVGEGVGGEHVGPSSPRRSSPRRWSRATGRSGGGCSAGRTCRSPWPRRTPRGRSRWSRGGAGVLHEREVGVAVAVEVSRDERLPHVCRNSVVASK